MICEWCGVEHARDALCTARRPGWSRRGFLALFGAGLAGLAIAPMLPAIESIDPATYVHWVIKSPAVHDLSTGQIVAEAWELCVTERLRDDSIFNSRYLYDALGRGRR